MYFVVQRYVRGTFKVPQTLSLFYLFKTIKYGKTENN